METSKQTALGESNVEMLLDVSSTLTISTITHERKEKMKHKLLQDLGIDIDDETKDVMNQFNLNGFLDEISDNRIKDENKKFDEMTNNKEE